MEIIIPCILGGAILGIIIRAALNIGKSNAPIEISYPYGKDDILEIVPRATEDCKYTIENLDKISGTVKIGVGLNARTYGEYITMHLIPVDKKNTRIVYSCRAKYGRENISKNQSNIERISNAVSQRLQNVPQSPSDNKNISVADELLKLKNLLDKGIITEEEFDSQKKKFLDSYPS